MGYLKGEFIPSSIISGSGASGQQSVPTVSMLDVTVNISAVSGTTPALDIFMEQSDDGGTTWFAVSYDKQLTHTATAADVAANTNRRNINGTSSASAAGKHTAQYKHVPSGLVRLNYVVSGTYSAGQGFTLTAKWQGK